MRYPHRIPGSLALASILFSSCTSAPVVVPVATAGRCAEPEPDLFTGPSGDSLHQYVSRLARLGVFSGAVLVARRDTVLLHGGYGLADQRRCIPIRRSTVFDIGSVAKQFAATAILRLEQDGKLHTGDSLHQFFADVPVEKRGITIHQLLTHTSGLPGDFELPGQRTTLADDPSLDTRLLALPLGAAPGSQFRYSNAGYVLIRRIVERVSGMPYRRYVTEELLRRAGLARTGWHGDSGLWAPGEVAHGSWGRYDSGSPREWISHAATLGSGEMVSSVGELHRWVRALESDMVINAGARHRLFAPQAQRGGANDANRDASAFYGYGWEIRNNASGKPALIFHNGTFDNFRTTVRHYLGDSTYIIVTTNHAPDGAGDRADEMANTLRDVMRGNAIPEPPQSVELPATALRRLEGQYVLADGARFRIWRATGNRLWIAPLDPQAFTALWNPDPARTALHQAVAQRSRSLIDSLRALPCDGRQSGWSEVVCGVAARTGRITRIELIGVAPITWSTDIAMVYTSLHGSGGTEMIVWQWRGEQLLGTWVDPQVQLPQSAPLAAVDGSGRFILYDVFNDRIRTVDLSDGVLQLGGAARPLASPM